jgi:hypothetical protein
MPPNHQQYTQWNGERFRNWAAKIGPNTQAVVETILTCYKVEQQGYRACMALLKLSEQYSAERLEGACTKALFYTPRPSYKSIQTILKSGRMRSRMSGRTCPPRTTPSSALPAELTTTEGGASNAGQQHRKQAPRNEDGRHGRRISQTDQG